MEVDFKDFLRDDQALLKKYEMSEARYLVSTEGQYEKVEIELNISKEQLSKFIACLAKYNICFDEWANFVLVNEIIRLELSREQDNKILD